MDIFLHVVHVLAALALIGLVLLQQGKGADAGASFGGGASNTVFGSAGSANFLTRATAGFAVVFFVTSLALAWLAREQSQAAADPILPMLEKVQQDAEVPEVPVSDVPTEESDVPALQQETTDVPQADVESATPAQQPAE